LPHNGMFSSSAQVSTRLSFLFSAITGEGVGGLEKAKIVFFQNLSESAYANVAYVISAFRLHSTTTFAIYVAEYSTLISLS